MRRRRQPTAWDHNALGAHFYQVGAYDLAMTELREATRLLPDHPSFQYNLACVYHVLHREAEAIAALRQALALDPSHIKARLLLGQLLVAQGDAGAARVELEAVLASSSECSEAAKAREEFRKLKSPQG